MAPRKTFAVAAVVALSAVSLAACGGGDDNSGNSSNGGPATMQFWHNATTGPGKAFWDKTVADFQNAHPNVKIQIQAIQNEDLDGKLQTALNSGSAPDIFFQRGGGKMTAMVEAGQVKDITKDLTAETKQAVGDAALKTEQIEGKTYAVPVSILPGGFWYSQDLFKKAGVQGTPTTLDELNGAVSKLKAQGAPIALGAKDAWPALTGTTSSFCAHAPKPRSTPLPKTRSSPTPAGRRPVKISRPSPTPSHSTRAS